MNFFPLFWLIQPITAIISYPLKFITDSPFVWHVSYILIAMAIYFLIGLLISKVIRLFFKKEINKST